MIDLDAIDQYRIRLGDRAESFDLGYRIAQRDGWADRIVTFSDACAVAAGCVYDADLAAVYVNQIPTLFRQSKGEWAGKPLVLLPWEQTIVENIFGWLRPDGTRRFRKAYIEVPKKNGKSTLMAALSLLMLVCDGEPGAEVYVGAVTRKQASIIHDEAARMVRQSPVLSEHLRIIDSTKTILFDDNDGVLRALSADVESQEGLNASCVIIDELHAHKRRKFFDTLVYSGTSRKQPLFMVITTAGEYDPESIGWEQHEYATNVLSGVFEDWQFYPVIYAAKQDADWTDPAVWKAANPSFGVTMSESDFMAQCDEAQNKPTKQASFKRYRLNIWVQAAEAWLDMRQYHACAEKYTLADLRGRKCYGGLDLSSTKDLSAFALVFPPAGKDRFFRSLCWLWLPAENAVERAKENAAPYALWTDLGWVRLTHSGTGVIDYGEIRRCIAEEIKPQVRLDGIAYDPYRATEIVQALQNECRIHMEPHRFGSLSMNAPMTELEKKIIGREFVHDGNPVQAWMFGNVTAISDSGGLIKPDRSNVKKKIDGAVAVMLGFSYALAKGHGKRSVYADRGLVVL